MICFGSKCTTVSVTAVANRRHLNNHLIVRGCGRGLAVMLVLGLGLVTCGLVNITGDWTPDTVTRLLFMKKSDLVFNIKRSCVVQCPVARSRNSRRSSSFKKYVLKINAPTVAVLKLLNVK
jgi:hypothetical protein